MLKLYDYPDCPFCQKVRVMLAEKDLEYEKIFVDLRKQEQKSPDFLRLNPYGKVPVVVDEEEVIYDSTIINEYLEDEYPLPRLMPEDWQGRARVRLLQDYCDNSFIPPTTMLLAQLRKADAEREQQRVEQAREELRRSLYFLRDALGGREYLVGKEFTLADMAFAPRIMVLGRLGVELEPALAPVQTWIDRIRARPSVRGPGLFLDTSEAETGHAFGHLDFLKEVGDPVTEVPIGSTELNLKSAIEGETYEFTQMYPGFARTARGEGFEEVAEWFETLAKAEKSHAGRFTKGLQTLGQ